MPLYSYRCIKCKSIIEKFIKSEDCSNEISLKCPVCFNEIFEKVFGNSIKSNVYSTSTKYFEEILKPEIQKINENISKGKDEFFLDICGDE